MFVNFRSYKNGFVWQDLSENDFIYPCQGHEYVLKGSQLLESSLSFRSFESTVSSFSSSSSSSMFSQETNNPAEEYSNDIDPKTIIRRKNQSWGSSDDLREYRVYKPKTNKELAVKAANVSTQTDEKARPRKSRLSEVSLPERNGGLESLIGSMEVEGSGRNQTVDNACECGKSRASTVLMQLITCGSTRIKDSGSIKSKD